MLMRFDPFQPSPSSRARQASAPMDAVRSESQVLLSFELPGVDRASIDLEVERNVLTLTAERPRPEFDDAKVITSERRFGTISRRVLLSDDLDGDAIEASFVDGVLSVTIPVADKAKAHKIAVAVGVPTIDTEVSSDQSEN